MPCSHLEFLDLMSQLAKEDGPPDTQQELLDAFAVFDQDGSGTISPAELRQVLVAQGEKYTDSEIDDMISHVDLDGDGLINCESCPLPSPILHWLLTCTLLKRPGVFAIDGL
jgi:Ca2+-binding EF-hand superfamily protein